MKHLFRIADGVIFAVTACLSGIVLLYPRLWVMAPFFVMLFVDFVPHRNGHHLSGTYNGSLFGYD